jgi:hypothetical protein
VNVFCQPIPLMTEINDSLCWAAVGYMETLSPEIRQIVAETTGSFPAFLWSALVPFLAGHPVGRYSSETPLRSRPSRQMKRLIC